jgi:copper transport protein
LTRLLAALAVVAVALVAVAAPASAHATLLTSSPTSGQHLAAPPAAVTLHFDQRVVPTGTGLSVLNSSGDVVSTKHVGQPDPNTLVIPLRRGLPDGAYVADYTVLSTDGHIVSGGVVFLVGAASPGRIGALAHRSTTGADDLDKVGQFLTYLGVLTAVGIAFFAAFVSEDGRDRRRLFRWAVGATGVGLVGMAITIESQAALAAGGHLAFASFDALRSAASGDLGQQCLVQLTCLAGALVSLRVAQRTTAQVLALYSTLGAAGAFVLFGHARAASALWVTMAADVLHVVCAAVWLGGLIGLVTVLRARTAEARHTGELPPSGGGPSGAPDRGPVPSGAAVTAGGTSVAVLTRPTALGTIEETAETDAHHDPILGSTVAMVRRVSTVAAWSVIALMIAGLVLGIELVGSIRALFETTYGQLLLAKLAVFGLLLVMAAYNRWFLLPWVTPSSASSASVPVSEGSLRAGWGVLAKTARVEVLGVVAVLGLTAMLTNTTPPSSVAAVRAPVPFSQSAPFEGGHLRLRITPNQALVNDLTVDLTDAAGRPVDRAKSVSIFFTLPAKQVGPLSADLKRVGVGHYVLSDTPLPPIVGDWEITLQMRVDDFNQTDVNFTDAVR